MTIREIFKTKKHPLLNIYFTAGYPQKDSLLEILPALEEAGVDMVEIGIPYSDPLSDGKTIQQSSAIALNNGITVDSIFEQLTRSQTSIPMVMMGYFNVVYQYGIEAFCKKCQQTGISGLILPDLPIDLYLGQYQDIFKAHDLSNIYLVTPETSPDRIRFIDDHSDAFIYAVSTSSTTGSKTGIEDAGGFLERLQKMDLKTPVMVGFNLSTAEDFDFVARYCSGGIIGSAFIRHIAKSKDLKTDTITFVQSILENQFNDHTVR
jgi:tryptophan synthase alpha chain